MTLFFADVALFSSFVALLSGDVARLSGDVARLSGDVARLSLLNKFYPKFGDFRTVLATFTHFAPENPKNF